MYRAIKISEYVISYSNTIGSPISNLKLQKLLYYIQAATLVERGEKCFEEPITAWEFGPVVIPVYQTYREYGRSNIPEHMEMKEMVFDFSTMKIKYRDSKAIDPRSLSIIKKVIEAYKHISNPFELVKKTHQEKPWKDTRLNEEIKCEKIRAYYSKHIDKLYGW